MVFDFDFHTISYWVNLLMFLPVPILLIMFLNNIVKLSGVCNLVSVLAVATGIASVVLFLIAQVSWVLLEHSQSLPMWAVNVWLLFDGANAAYYLTSSAVMYIQSEYMIGNKKPS